MSAPTAVAEAPPPVLELRRVDKSFPGVRALVDVGIRVRPHEVVGLVGENGAGKSTLMRVLAGVYRPDAGEYRLRGHPVTLSGPRDAARHGVGMVFQEQSLLPNLTVAEIIYLGAEQPLTRFGLIRWRALYAAARRQLDKVRANIDPAARTAELSFAARQMVELAKALTLEEQVEGDLVVLLDEPTSVLERAEIDILFERVRALKERAAFVFVSHRLDEVLALSDRIYVMKDGRVVADLAAGEADVHTLHRLMVGRGLQAEYYREPLQRPYGSEVVMAAEGLGLAGAFRDVSFELHRGEILGIAGVIGSGREELTRTLFGFAPHTAGRLLIGGREVRLNSPAQAVDHGIGYVPRDRRGEGLVLFLSVRANVTLASLERVRRHGLIDREAEGRLARDWIEKLKIRTPGPEALCLNLSGGNQQKVVLAKWLNAMVRIVVLDHPTRGLDVGAKEEVYELVRALTNAGISVVLTADTLEETIGLSHTILVMRDGVVTKRLNASPGRKPEQVELIEHMV
ncbi:MAG TPA: sugar ABC transporter ATP-binding protein [Geminicoccaceae bacterium]|nr:sugar ABC transporter ATP-binding protein [Geminicoccaceae bacterium]